MVRFLVEVPRWLLVVSLIFAPWAYGSIRPWALAALSGLMGGLSLFWLVECWVRRRRPSLSWAAILPVLALACQGWWMVINSHAYFDADLNALLPMQSLVSGAPGSADGPASAVVMFFITGLLGVFLFCCDQSRHAVWQKRIWLTLVLTGFSIAAFGVLQKLGGDAVLALVWEPDKREPADNFATFRYRGNAGAYLNLIFPLMAGFTFLAFQRVERHGRKAFWAVSLFVLILGIQLNPSRISWFIAVLLGLVMATKVVWFYKTYRRDSGSESVAVLACAAGLVLLAVSAICFLGSWETSLRRFDLLGFNPADRSPVEIYIRMVPDAGVLGFGPGTFGTVFPSYQQTYDFGGRTVPSFWTADLFSHAHEDYLETLIEWGWLGTLFWSVLILGGIARGTWQSLRKSTPLSRHWLLFGSLLAVSGLLFHATIDFPLQIPAIELYVFVLLGFCWGSSSNREARQGEIP